MIPSLLRAYLPVPAVSIRHRNLRSRLAKERSAWEPRRTIGGGPSFWNASKEMCPYMRQSEAVAQTGLVGRWLFLSLAGMA